MNGHFLLNLDHNYISYDFNVNVPLIGERALTLDELKNAVKECEDNNKNEIRFRTNQLDGLHIQFLNISELDSTIDKFEKMVADLKELKAKADEHEENKKNK